MRAQLPERTPTLVEDGLYLATAETLLQRIRDISDDVQQVLLIGHNPGLEDLGTLLAGPALMAAGLPTGALVGIPFHGARWAEVGPDTVGTGRVWLHPGRDR